MRNSDQGKKNFRNYDGHTLEQVAQRACGIHTLQRYLKLDQGQGSEQPGRFGSKLEFGPALRSDMD